MSFASLGLAPDIVRAVTEHGYTTPTPIQAQAIPLVLAGKDVLAGAQTGTGKTAGFTLPMLHRLQDGPRRKLRALVLTPTRELAAQVEESVRTYGKHLPLRSAVVFGGVGINPQVEKLRQGVDILVATPGRLLDLAGQKAVDLGGVEILVLDEADRMLDMGFIHDLRRILALLPRNRQNLLFSATYSDDIKRLAEQFLHNPEYVEVARRNTAAETVQQRVFTVDQKRKRELLSFLIGSNDWRQVLVFTRTKHGANRLAEQLGKDGLTSAAIHGNKSQGARTRALSDFKSGAVRVLVATDIAARGLDIDQLPHVVNFELPNVPEDYVHRIGRTGRAGAAGHAVSLVCADERDYLKSIERLIRRSLPQEQMPGFEPGTASTAAPEPEDRRPPRPRQGAPRHRDGQRDASASRGNPQGRRPRSAGTGQQPNGAAGNTARGNGNGVRREVNGNRAEPATRGQPQKRRSDRPFARRERD